MTQTKLFMTAKRTVTTKRISVNKQTRKAEVVGNAIPLILYRRMALLFVVLVAGVLIAVLYLATMQAVIRVTAVSKEIPADFVVRTVEVATGEGEVQGEIRSGSLGRTKIFTPSDQSAQQVEAEATGVVTITNATSASQPLISTTRLITPDGVLFRLKRGVTVPANESVEAEVYADQKGASGNIGPSPFIIPGLNPAKQQLITAASSVPMTGGVQSRTVLSQQEIDDAIAVFKEELLEDAKAMLRQERKQPYQGEAFFLEVRSQKTDAKAGDEVGDFEIEMEVKVTGVFFDEEALKKIARRKLYEALGQGQEFVDLGEADRAVTVQQVNATQEVASIHVKQSGRAIPSRTSQALEVGRFVGMDEDQVKQTLLDEGVALDVEVDFFPFWVRTVPRLKDHVYVEIR